MLDTFACFIDVAKIILVTINCIVEHVSTSMSGVDRNYLQHHLVDDLSQREGDVPHVRQEAFHFLPGKFGEKPVLRRLNAVRGIVGFLSPFAFTIIFSICVLWHRRARPDRVQLLYLFF
jgi:hypothetical protein